MNEKLTPRCASLRRLFQRIRIYIQNRCIHSVLRHREIEYTGM
jgi:hypothetical protein